MNTQPRTKNSETQTLGNNEQSTRCNRASVALAWINITNNLAVLRFKVDADARTASRRVYEVYTVCNDNTARGLVIVNLSTDFLVK